MGIYMNGSFPKFIKNIFDNLNIKTVLNDDDEFSEIYLNHIFEFDGYFIIDKKNIFFELKGSNNISISQNRLIESIEYLRNNIDKTIQTKYKEDLIFFITSKITSEQKQLIYEKYHTIIFDISNILFLVEIFTYQKVNIYFDLTKQLSMVVKYNINSIESESISDLVKLIKYTNLNSTFIEKLMDELQKQKVQTDKNAHLYDNEDYSSFQQKLLAVESFKQFEEWCENILKKIFEKHLFFYEKQSRTCDNLNIFDLISSIRTPVTSQFFDIVKNHFNSRYIIFECKNYSEPISQREVIITEKYMFKNALRNCVILITMNGMDENAYKITQCAIREQGKLILHITANELLNLLSPEIINPDDLLLEKLDELLVKLEK